MVSRQDAWLADMSNDKWLNLCVTTLHSAVERFSIRILSILKSCSCQFHQIFINFVQNSTVERKIKKKEKTGSNKRNVLWYSFFSFFSSTCILLCVIAFDYFSFSFAFFQAQSWKIEWIREKSQATGEWKVNVPNHRDRRIQIHKSREQQQ